MRFTPLQKAVIDAVDTHGRIHVLAWGKNGMIHSIRTLFAKTRDSKYHNFSYKCTGQEIVVYDRSMPFFEPDYKQYCTGFETHWLWTKSDLKRKGRVDAPSWRTLRQRVVDRREEEEVA